MAEIFPETPMPVGPEPQALSTERLAEIAECTRGAARLAPRAWMGIGRELLAEIGRLELTVRQMVEGLNGHDCPPPGEAPLDTVTRWVGYLDTAETRVAELEAERHSTNEALDDAVQELRARQSCLCPPADQPGPHQVGCPLAEVQVRELGNHFLGGGA